MHAIFCVFNIPRGNKSSNMTFPTTFLAKFLKIHLFKAIPEDPGCGTGVVGHFSN